MSDDVTGEGGLGQAGDPGQVVVDGALGGLLGRRPPADPRRGFG